jgi:predicted  nucleic acid-binding Zn-ribbon protein
MMLIEDFKKGINNSLKKVQEKTAKQVEVLKEEAQKSLKELLENTTKQVMGLNKSIQDLKMEVETIKKTQKETTLEIEILGKKSGTINASISNRIKEMEETIASAEDSTENLDTIIKKKKNCKMQKDPNSKIKEIQDTMRRPTLRIIGRDENEDFHKKNNSKDNTYR